MCRFAVVAVGCCLVSSPLLGEYQSAGTKAMAVRLEKIIAGMDWKGDPNKTAERVAYLREQLGTHPPVEGELNLRQFLGAELLRQGDSEAAIRELEAARALAQAHGMKLPVEAERQSLLTLGMAYLRLGEQENCMHYHGQKSCIFPIDQSGRGGGVHKLPRGAAGAVRNFEMALAVAPEDAQLKWLLNIAYMQLGRYPKEVPAKYLIPAALFESDYDIGEFPDVAALAGVDVTEHAGGVCMQDFDGDGFLDLMISSSGPKDQLRFFHSNGDGTFTERTFAAGLRGETGGLNIVCADYNNDGHPDVVVLRGGWWGKFGDYPISLLKNNGDGTFDDVTEAAGLLGTGKLGGATQTAAWADFDGDGWLDLFVGRESTADDRHASQLFRNNHDGTFTDVAPALGLTAMDFVKGVAWGDFNNDGRPDLYVSVKGGSKHLFRNDGAITGGFASGGGWKFTDVTERAGVTGPNHTFATWFFDYDNDGWPDIFLAGYSVPSPQDIGAFEMGKPSGAQTPTLFRNNHDGTFSDVTKAVRLDRAIDPMGSSFGDLDNDGWLDIYLGTGDPNYESLLPNKMFRNDGGKVFQDVTTAGGFGNLQKGHSVAFGDLGNNGNEDIFEEMGGAFVGDTYESTLYRNPGHGNHWMTLELEGVKSNRAAIGARIDVTLDAPVKRHIYRTVGFGSSFGGNPLRQHIGLGKAERIAAVEIWWPASGVRQRFVDVAVDTAFKVREDREVLVPAGWKSFVFPKAPVGNVPMPAGMHH